MLANTKDLFNPEILFNQIVKIFYHSFTTPLEDACLTGENKLVMALLEAKADPNLSSTPRNSPLYIVCRKSPKFEKITQSFLPFFDSINSIPLNIKLIRMLLDAGAKVDEELTPLLTKCGILNNIPVTSACESKYPTAKPLQIVTFKFLFEALYHGLKTSRILLLNFQNLLNSIDLAALVIRRFEKLITDDKDSAEEDFKTLIFSQFRKILENDNIPSMLNLPSLAEQPMKDLFSYYHYYHSKRTTSLQKNFLNNINESKTDDSFWSRVKKEELSNITDSLQGALRDYTKMLLTITPWGGPLEIQAVSYLFKIKIILSCNGIEEPCMCVGQEYKTTLQIYYSPDEDTYSLQELAPLQEITKISRRHSFFNIPCENDSKGVNGNKSKKVRTSQDDIMIGVNLNERIQSLTLCR